MVGVEQWAEVRRMKRVEGLSAREIGRGRGWRGTRSRRLLAAEAPPRYSRAPAGSILDPFKDWICEQLRADPKIPSQRLREMAVEIGYAGGKTIFDAYVREVRPRFLVKRTFQRTIYRPAELIQCDLWEPSEHVPVGHGQTASWLGRDVAVVLVAGVRRHPGVQQGGAGHPRWGLAPQPAAAWGAAGEAGLGPRVSDRRAWQADRAVLVVLRPAARSAGSILDAGDPQAKGQLERQHRFLRSNFEPRPVASRTTSTSRTSSTAWAEKVNGRVHRTIRGCPGRAAGQGARADAAARRGDCRDRSPPGDRGSRSSRWSASIATTTRSTRAFAGRRVEVRVSQTRDHRDGPGHRRARRRHSRSSRADQTIIDPAHQTQLELQRQRRRQRHQVDVEHRRCRVYDALIPA